MREVVWTDSAQADVHSILDYWTKRNGSDLYSQKLARKFRVALFMCAAYRKAAITLGGSGFQYIIVGPYAIYYTMNEQHLVVHHVWDQRRDPKKHPLTGENG